MLDILLPALRVSLVTWAICGIAYPMAVTGLAQRLFSLQANGSLVAAPDGTILGSAIIGQAWSGPAWFHGRPSATTTTDPNDPSSTIAGPYNAASSGGSNLGPTSKQLFERLTADRAALELQQPKLRGVRLPADMLTTSSSGLDPDISPANATLQVPRIAAARGVRPAEIEALVQRYTAPRQFGLLGEPRVNVLSLNVALNRAYPRR